MAAVHQVLPVFAPRDAIGNHTAAVRRALRAVGINGEIFAGEVVGGAGHGARTLRHIRPARLAATEPTVWVYHASTGSAVADWWAALPGPKALEYHNITPAELISPWEPSVGVELEHGRRQLAELADVPGWALAVSRYNAEELAALGYRNTMVAPILSAAPGRSDPADPGVLARLQDRRRRDGGADWLMVSRLLPHKAQHDVVKAFAVYRAVYDHAARLTLVGAVGSARYADSLAEFVDDLGLAPVVEITGSVSSGELAARYRTADVYVSASEHEGFGVPLLEAMAHDLPVVAYASSAVPETVGAAAVVVADKSAGTLAAAVRRVVTDPALRAALVAAGVRRVAELSPAAATRARLGAVARILDDAGIERPPALAAQPGGVTVTTTSSAGPRNVPPPWPSW